MKYFIVPKLAFENGGEKSYKPDGSKEKVIKKSAKITIEKLDSDIFTFNIPMKNEKKQASGSVKKQEV